MEERKAWDDEEKKKLQGLDNEINIIIEEGQLKAQNLYNESKEKINKENLFRRILYSRSGNCIENCHHGKR